MATARKHERATLTGQLALIPGHNDENCRYHSCASCPTRLAIDEAQKNKMRVRPHRHQNDGVLKKICPQRPVLRGLDTILYIYYGMQMGTPRGAPVNAVAGSPPVLPGKTALSDR
jgi:hypothetical protein